MKALSDKQKKEFLQKLEDRFTSNKNRHAGLLWADVHKRLEKHPEKLWSLHAMEATGGEPDVISYDKKTGEIVFFDCAPESPKGRRSFCYDKKALDARKENKPKNNALDAAKAMGVQLLNEEEYQKLQSLGAFDTKTSSWLLTPPAIRNLGGAIFGDRRFDHVFIYHNGAESYYAGRGFRGSLRV